MKQRRVAQKRVNGVQFLLWSIDGRFPLPFFSFLPSHVRQARFGGTQASRLSQVWSNKVWRQD